MLAIPRQSVNLSLKEFKAICKSIASRQISTGPCLEEFESQFAKYIGVRHALAVSSGRAAQYLALKSLNLEPGSEIIVPAYTFYIVPVIVKAMGLRPVFADIQLNTYNLEPAEIEKKVTSKTKCIIATHIAGQPCDIDRIREIAARHNLYMLEDCAEACGAEYKGRRAGSFGDISYYSFHVSKNLTCLGGGMITTNNEELFLRIRKLLGPYGMVSTSGIWKKIVYTLATYLFTRPLIFTFSAYPLILLASIIGGDWLDAVFTEKPSLSLSKIEKDLARMSELQAGVGLKQLFRLKEMNSQRAENSAVLYEQLKDCQGIHLQEGIADTKTASLFFYIGSTDRKRLRKRLLFSGVDTRGDVLSACNKLDIFDEEKTQSPYTEKLAAFNIIIPNYPSLKKRDMHRIADKIKRLL